MKIRLTKTEKNRIRFGTHTLAQILAKKGFPMLVSRHGRRMDGTQGKQPSTVAARAWGVQVAGQNLRFEQLQVI